jgi:hypothetical protein
MVLDLDGRIEEEDLGFGEVHLHARSFTKEVDDRFECRGLLGCGYSH